MRRREFITLLGGAAAVWPLSAHAQQPPRVPRVAVLMNAAETDSEGQARVTLFSRRLQELGWTDSRNAQIIHYWGANSPEKLQAAVAQLLAQAPDVVVQGSGAAGLAMLQQATRTIPIVFVMIVEPVAEGFVQNLAHPGANITGFTNLEPTVGGKWLELLKEIAPRVTRVAVMSNPEVSPPTLLYALSIEQASKQLAIEVARAPVRQPADIEAAMARLARDPGGGLILPPDSFTVLHRSSITKLAAQYGLPAIYGQRIFAEEGALVTYGINASDQFRKAADYVNRILHGEKPADLPVEQPTKFELVINLHTARALGLDVPPVLSARADEVIE
jgi:putative tryptophan/tyrosine transport system substrate-binding protein